MVAAVKFANYSEVFFVTDAADDHSDLRPRSLGPKGLTASVAVAAPAATPANV